MQKWNNIGENMDIKFTAIQTKSERKYVQELYNRSVPAHEKSYFYLLWWKRKRKNVSFVNVYDSDKWVGFAYYSTHDDLVYIGFFATVDSKTSKKYDEAMFNEFKRLYPKHRIAISIEIENTVSDNVDQAAKEATFYHEIGFKPSGYYVFKETDSFEVVVFGGDFDIEELYRVNKEVYPLIGNFLSSVTRKQIQKRV